MLSAVVTTVVAGGGTAISDVETDVVVEVETVGKTAVEVGKGIGKDGESGLANSPVEDSVKYVLSVVGRVEVAYFLVIDYLHFIAQAIFDTVLKHGFAKII